jgi:hypothetical protein
MHTTRVVTGLLATAVFGLAGVAQAGDVKIYSGATCKPTFASSETGYSYALGLFNSEVPGWDITCPIDRDVTDLATGFRLRVFAAPGSGPTTCTAFIRNLTVVTDTFLDFETRSTPSGGDGVVLLDWGDSLSSGGAEAVYHLECHLDVYGLLSGYRVDEP